MGQWRTQIAVLAIAAVSSIAHAGEFGYVKCDECNYKSEKVVQGGTKYQAMHGQSTKIFFCADSKKFVSLTTGKKAQVSSKLKAKECKSTLVPLEDLEGKPCPVCNKGKVEFVSEGFVD